MNLAMEVNIENSVINLSHRGGIMFIGLCFLQNNNNKFAIGDFKRCLAKLIPCFNLAKQCLNFLKQGFNLPKYNKKKTKQRNDRVKQNFFSLKHCFVAWKNMHIFVI